MCSPLKVLTILILSLANILNSKANNNVSLVNACIDRAPNGLIIWYDIVGNTDTEVVVTLSFHNVETGIEIVPSPGSLSGAVNANPLRAGRDKFIRWDWSSDLNTPYSNGTLELSAYSLTTVQSDVLEDYKKTIDRKNGQLIKIQNRLRKRGKAETSSKRYKRISKKVASLETTYNSVVKKLSHQNKNRIVVPGFFDFQDLCESEIYEIAKKHSLRPKKLEDLSDGTSFVGKIYSGRELFGLQFQELFSLTSERGTYSSSVFFVRKYDQEISYQKKKYRVTWAVGIMISVVTEHNKIEAFSDFYESAIFLKQGKYKNKFKIQSIGVVGRGIDSEI